MTVGVDYRPLLGFEIRALLANTHLLVAKPHPVTQDLAGQTVITWPVPDETLDLIRRVLEPADVRPPGAPPSTRRPSGAV